MPHDLTDENCRSPTEAALLPPHDLEVTKVSDYREEKVLSLSTARKMTVESIQKAKYKRIYDRDTRPVHSNIGDWVLVKFPQDEAGQGNSGSYHDHGVDHSELSRGQTLTSQ